MKRIVAKLKKKIHFGWVIVFAGVVITAVGAGTFNSTNGIFIKPICDEFGFSRVDFTLHRTIITLLAAFLLPLYGRLIKRTGVKPILIISAGMIGLVFVGYSFSTQLWHFYVLAVVNGLFMNGVYFMIVGVLIDQWFEDKKGLAVGIAYCGSGLGSSIMVPVITQIIEASGWRWGYIGIAVVSFLILLPVVLITKECSKKKGYTPYKSKIGQSKPEKAEHTESELSLKEAARTPIFWLMMVAFLFIAICAGGPNSHLVPYFTDIGYTATFAASVFSLYAISLTVGKIVLGGLFDRLGSLNGSIIVGACCIAFPLLALFANYTGIPWVFAVMFGLASCGYSVPINLLVADYFGTKDFPSIFSYINMMTVYGLTIAIPLMSAIYDSTGSYFWAWVVLGVLAAIATLCLIGAYALNAVRLRKQ